MRKTYYLLPIFVLLFSSCSMFKSKASDYYLSKAEKIYKSNLSSDKDLRKAYAYIEKSLQYNPQAFKALNLLEDLSDSAYRGGYSDALEMEVNVLKKYIKKNPYSWNAYLLIINALALRGDVFALNEISENLSVTTDFLKGKNEKDKNYFHANLALGLCCGTIIPWIQSEGYLNINRNSQKVIGKTKEYMKFMDKLYEVNKVIKKMAASDATLRKNALSRLLNSYDIALEDVTKNKSEILRMKAIAKKIQTDKQFVKGISMTVEGNVHFMRKDFSKARIMYAGAVGNYPDFIDAKKQIAEIDFQQGALIAITGDKKSAIQLLYKAYEETDDVIELLKRGNHMPFASKNKFAAETYSLKAAIISAINALKKGNVRSKMALEREFKYYLDKAVKYNPENRLARDLLDRYAREGF
ncbi:MAG: hypothetical protein KAR84_01220 [Elusimicrobiales bacterium]|nr:hypothetical protein [Elusimicrobiales bacterium]